MQHQRNMCLIIILIFCGHDLFDLEESYKNVFCQNYIRIYLDLIYYLSSNWSKVNFTCFSERRKLKYRREFLINHINETDSGLAIFCALALDLGTPPKVRLSDHLDQRREMTEIV